jgi:Zn-dependent protease with chaperone function
MRKWLEWTIVFGAVGFILYCIVSNPSVKETAQQRVARIYQQINVQAGAGIWMPISVNPSPIVNAYNTGSEIVIYQGLIDNCKNDDELALVIGHEIAHSTLSHFELSDGDPILQTALEAQADKMGAYYIMRAGYDVCKAREFWLRSIKENGDYPGGDHPTLAYRFSELNVNCSAGL